MNKYKKEQRKAQKERSKNKMCIDKKSFEDKEEAQQNGMIVYKCKFCKKYHRSSQRNRFIKKICG